MQCSLDVENNITYKSLVVNYDNNLKKVDARIKTKNVDFFKNNISYETNREN